MKSVFKSNISWFILLFLFGILLPYAMEKETNPPTQIYSLKELQNDFIGLWKNPQKYVEFQLNAEGTSQPDAGGLYELRPYYEKVNALGEKTNYAIQWCAFETKWKLVEANQIGVFPSLDNELSTITTLLEGEQFSRPTKADIKAYTTYEQMKSSVNTVGIKNKELKIKIIKIENELFQTHVENEKQKKFVREKNEAFKILKVFVQKANEINQSKTEQYTKTFEEYQENLKEMEFLKLNLNEKEIQILNNNESISALNKQNGCLSYQLSMIQERDQQFKSLQKDVSRSIVELKQKTEKFNACENKICELESLLIKKNEKIHSLKQRTREQEDRLHSWQDIKNEASDDFNKLIMKNQNNLAYKNDKSRAQDIKKESSDDFKNMLKKQMAVTQGDVTLDFETIKDKIHSITKRDENFSLYNAKRSPPSSKKKKKAYRGHCDEGLKLETELHQLCQDVKIDCKTKPEINCEQNENQSMPEFIAEFGDKQISSMEHWEMDKKKVCGGGSFDDDEAKLDKNMYHCWGNVEKTSKNLESNLSEKTKHKIADNLTLPEKMNEQTEPDFVGSIMMTKTEKIDQILFGPLMMEKIEELEAKKMNEITEHDFANLFMMGKNEKIEELEAKKINEQTRPDFLKAQLDKAFWAPLMMEKNEELEAKKLNEQTEPDFVGPLMMEKNEAKKINEQTGPDFVNPLMMMSGLSGLNKRIEELEAERHEKIEELEAKLIFQQGLINTFKNIFMQQEEKNHEFEEFKKENENIDFGELIKFVEEFKKKQNEIDKNLIK